MPPLEPPAHRERVRPTPCIAASTWKPGEFVSLAGAKTIAIDLETYDPHLLEHGPGWARGDGHIVGLAIGTDDGFRAYYPMRHAVGGEQNLPADKVLAWARDQLKGTQPKIGANIIYDLGWLQQEGVLVGGQAYDVQYAEALLTEDGRTNLDTLGEKYCNEGKRSHALYEWCARAYGGNATDDQRKHIWHAPASLVGPYAEGDVDLPLRVLAKQGPLLDAEGLADVFDMECRLIPLLLAMRFRGVRVDVTRAEQLREKLLQDEAAYQTTLDTLAGGRVDVNATATIKTAFDRAGAPYPRTEKDNPSFTKLFLQACQEPIARAILDVRRVQKIRSTFVEGYILNGNVKGRVHCNFHPLRTTKDAEDSDDSNGTRSGRFSSDTPNLQNIPSRDPELAPLIRGLFIPDESAHWVKADYSQIEYRIFAHYARGPGSDKARAMYRDNPRTDFHEWTLDLVAPIAKWDISTKALRKQRRSPIKGISFGVLYGMGEDKLAKTLGLDEVAAKALFAAYHRGVPFVRPTANHASAHAARYGEVRTMLGRKSRFTQWEPDWRALSYDEKATAGSGRPLPYAEAVQAYSGQIRRAHTHKALNRILQGTAADLMKMAMLRCWEDGLFSTVGVPHLTVHDELDFSDTGANPEAFAEIIRTMETCLPFEVPIRVEVERGADWGHTVKESTP